MKNIQIVGGLTVIAGSLLPLVHVPLIGNWNYWELEPVLAVACWALAAMAVFGIVNNRAKIVRILAVLLILLFLFTLFAVKYQTMQYFSFLPFSSWQNKLSGIVQLKWGWAAEFLGAFMMLLAGSRRAER